MFSLPSVYDLTRTYRLFDDFLHVHDWWTVVNDGTTGTNTLNDAAGGTYSLVTAAADNDYHYLNSDSEAFLPARNRPMRAFARVRLSEAATDDANIIFGFSANAEAAAVIANDGAGLTAAHDTIAIYKVDGGTSWVLGVANGSAIVTETIGDFVNNTWTELYLEVGNAPDSTQLEVRACVVADGGTQFRSRPLYVTTSTVNVEMHALIGVKAGGSNAETLQVDLVAYEQER